ncbi:hypothetical protein [Plantactinospora soyae]|uniref:Uncharacterized protein n=1 Tax=Plantactinospora soyae TaxID=1544732 RepID=A0A927R0G4_9ACTN|nr:hypothetical protein [Plantactinospora soyae]MBE1488623.1 hypothetical protein [Plantactinospora soyae]
MPADPIGAVKRELLVRQLDSWTPVALHRSRRATFAQAYTGPDGGTADAALRVFVEFADLLRGRRMTVLTIAGATDELAVRHTAVQSELPAEVTAHLMPGDLARLPVALKAGGAAGTPVLAYLDATGGPGPDRDTIAAVTNGRPAELLLALDPPGPSDPDLRRTLTEAGFPLVTEVDLVADAPAEPERADAPAEPERIVFATAAGKRLDAFKDALWAVDEYAGVRYRDPGDPDGHLLDISLTPHPGPLRRELLARLATAGRASVTELRQFTAERTVYRAADTNRVLGVLLAAGLVDRDPAAGRLSGDVTITAI